MYLCNHLKIVFVKPILECLRNNLYILLRIFLFHFYYMFTLTALSGKSIPHLAYSNPQQF